MCWAKNSSRSLATSVPNASKKRSNGNFESINMAEPPGIFTVISGMPAESASVVDFCLVYSWPSRSPADCKSNSSWASPNFPLAWLLDKAPAIFLVSSKIDSLALRISLIVVSSFASASVRTRFASFDWTDNFSTVDFIAFNSAVNLIEFSVLPRSASNCFL